MQKLITALVKARAEFTSIQKDRVNPHYKSRYATLDAVLDAVTPALCNHGLAIVQSTATESGKTELKTFLYHESGEHISSSYPLPDTMDAQKLGAALTYARRYALCALLSVTADEDDDGNAGKSAPDQSAQQPKKPVNKADQNSRVKAIRGLLSISSDSVIEWLTANNAETPNDLTKQQLHLLIEGMALGWAKAQGLHSTHAQNSFRKHVSPLLEQGRNDLEAIQPWMEHVSKRQEPDGEVEDARKEAQGMRSYSETLD